MSEAVNQHPMQKPLAESGEPYEWDRCTVRLSITFLPTEADEDGREVIIGCNTHSDPPLIESIREMELVGALPPLITELLARLRQRLPEQAALAEARRQAEIAAEEKATLAEQKNEERIKAAGRRWQEKNHQSQKVPSTDAGNVTGLTDPAGDNESAITEQIPAAAPVNGKQQSLFG